MKAVTVFCGARMGAREIYREAAQTLGKEIAARGMTLVYGGGHVGLMGAVAEAALEAGGEVIGVIPEFMVERELGYGACTTLEVVDSMHTRKARMAELTDGFIAMPGGVGTFDELFEILTWAQIGLHAKPIGLLNTNDYFVPLRAMVAHAVNEGFVGERDAARLLMANDSATLLQILQGEPSQSAGEWWKT
ncbi:TIGR00730 family Rossman fold protein [Chitinibacter fontanus]|uniref:Cytokinin riboside 5'-monophosphate phosphoribohydrolase n=1 Tax=Chitinibacter fontanus TaxID=1737446 RepID=A0A7D5ZEW7_9NEIS|nr:TIGR00730 family Rossman fold protein [Chitinibacter fontanus]QLI82705.1 TIGR00730 family Rossman fold protein [Chitinibacter fontanus]